MVTCADYTLQNVHAMVQITLYLLLLLGDTKLMSWSSDFRSIILKGREFYFFLILKKSLSSDLESA